MSHGYNRTVTGRVLGSIMNWSNISCGLFIFP